VFTGAAGPQGDVVSLAPEWVQVLHSHRPDTASTRPTPSTVDQPRPHAPATVLFMVPSIRFAVPEPAGVDLELRDRPAQLRGSARTPRSANARTTRPRTSRPRPGPAGHHGHRQTDSAGDPHRRRHRVDPPGSSGARARGNDPRRPHPAGGDPPVLPADQPVKTARTTLRDLRVAEVVKQDIHLEEDGAISYRTKLQVSFKYETES